MAKASIDNFINLCNQWGCVSWHLPHDPRIRSTYPEPFAEILCEYSPLVTPRQMGADGQVIWQIKEDSSCFAMLQQDETDPKKFRLKVNHLGWGGAKGMLADIPLEYDPLNGPSLKQPVDFEMNVGNLMLEEYRVHLTHGDTGLRDVLIWKDPATGARYVTTYVWCFTDEKPLASVDAEFIDPHFKQP